MEVTRISQQFLLKVSSKLNANSRGKTNNTLSALLVLTKARAVLPLQQGSSSDLNHVQETPPRCDDKQE